MVLVKPGDRASHPFANLELYVCKKNRINIQSSILLLVFAEGEKKFFCSVM